ncbi:hypothetical protein B0J12DRAFT_700538 [Macrophomina phaseolina]|uniref:Uncharacterized protein n=1 Tax=Macrophomina phaseolina TaxID=35725 RepID=A0ABQ8G7V2_9PEZI|nr:hypothetical protein B0J12DRAFT_700538 [Macrophomina phaseolina]
MAGRLVDRAARGLAALHRACLLPAQLLQRRASAQSKRSTNTQPARPARSPRAKRSARPDDAASLPARLLGSPTPAAHPSSTSSSSARHPPAATPRRLRSNPPLWQQQQQQQQQRRRRLPPLLLPAEPRARPPAAATAPVAVRAHLTRAARWLCHVCHGPPVTARGYLLPRCSPSCTDMGPRIALPHGVMPIALGNPRFGRPPADAGIEHQTRIFLISCADGASCGPWEYKREMPSRTPVMILQRDPSRPVPAAPFKVARPDSAKEAIPKICKSTTANKSRANNSQGTKPLPHRYAPECPVLNPTWRC